MKLFKLNANPNLNNELMETGALSLCLFGGVDFKRRGRKRDRILKSCQTIKVRKIENK